MTVSSFNNELLKSVCNILGNTTNGLTNAEIDNLLQIASIYDPTLKSQYFYEKITKRDRLYRALSLRQDQDKCGNNVANFLMLAMNPVRYTKNPEVFNSRLYDLNNILAFSGLQLDNSGKLRRVPVANTLPEAEIRANKLKHDLTLRNVHPDVLKYCTAELLHDNYFHAVLEATKSVSEKIRQKASVLYDGVTLVDYVYGFKKGESPRFTFNSFMREAEKMEQQGIISLLKGMFGTFRNPEAHEPKIFWEVNEQDAIELLCLASFLHRRIDSSKPLIR